MVRRGSPFQTLELLEFGYWDYFSDLHDEPAGRTVMVTTVRHTRKISSAALFITLDGRYDGSSQAQRSVEGLRSKTLELLEFGYWDYFSDLHDEPTGRTVVAPHLVRLPHLPSAAALRCHLRTVTGTTNRHKLRRWYFSVFLAKKNLRIHLLDRFSANKEKLT